MRCVRRGLLRRPLRRDGMLQRMQATQVQRAGTEVRPATTGTEGALCLSPAHVLRVRDRIAGTYSVMGYTALAINHPARPRGRKPSPPRSVVIIQERAEGKRRHMYTFTINAHSSEIHKVLHAAFAGRITH